MRTFLTALTSSALASAVLVGGMSSADASSRYSVTIAVSTDNVKLGHAFTISGSVSPGASGKTVDIQRKYAGGSWKTIAHGTLSSHSKYARSIKPSKAAFTSYRVVKAHSSSHSTGTSHSRLVTVSRWRYLTDLPQKSA
ncbi:MAG: hypothetical protein JWQ70_3105, partial [Aeromicrobium sp.]|nr:hypothetical protein [Aeromicrobium sp.]